MKAGGKINEAITEHNDRLIKRGDDQYVAIAAVGTDTCRYLNVEGDWSTDERNALVLERNEVSRYMSSISHDLFPYCRVVVVDRSRKGPYGQLPTFKGKL